MFSIPRVVAKNNVQGLLSSVSGPQQNGDIHDKIVPNQLERWGMENEYTSNETSILKSRKCNVTEWKHTS